MTGETLICPRCGGKTRVKRDGIFRWRYCPKMKACGWTVFTHGEHPLDKPYAVAP